MSERLPPTEEIDASTAHLDTLPTTELVTTLIDANRASIDAALRSAAGIAAAVDAIVTALRAQKHVHYVGAGTSGRLAVLDAAELPPTFGVSPELVRAHIAGGDAAIRRAIEGAEDDAEAGTALGHVFATGDVVIGISASGGAPFVIAALQAARALGATTVGIANAPDAALVRAAEIAIVLETGPEPISGSTRLKAGTAQKIVLNAISSAAMIQLGKVYGNLMVDVVATNAKLKRRAERLVHAILGADVDATSLLAAAGGNVKRAVVMQKLKVDVSEADRRLAAHGGRLGATIASS